MTSSPIAAAPLYLGCQVWNCDAWLDKVYPAKAAKRTWLEHYSHTFNTSEGNSTFYGLPELKTVARWGDETAPGFRFALKFPRLISHESRLLNCAAATRSFLQILESLHQADRLGPSFLQLGPDFSAAEFPVLETYLRSLPREFPYSVEVRHRDWFDQAMNENRLDSLLNELGIDRVLFDSRPLFAAPPTTNAERDAQRRKPRSPYRTTVTGPHPMVRLIGREDVAAVRPWLEEWAPIVAGWIHDGKTPYVFTHAPGYSFSPELAWTFRELLQEFLPEPLPLVRRPLARPQQATLFDL